jgi:thioredoxin 1
MLQITKENFEKEVKQSDIPVILDFFAGWCGPCQMLAPVFEKVSKGYEGKIKFAKVDTEEQPDLASEFEVRSIPCLIVFKDGKESDRIVGFQGEEALKQKVDELI